MGEPATLRLDSGDEVRVVVERDELDRDEITVRRIDASTPPNGELLRLIDEHLEAATAHPAGTTDRLLQADRERPF
jgi:hypothetical protein